MVAEALTLPRAMVEAMIRHARAFVPQECCGLIAAEQGRAVKRYELPVSAPATR